MKILLVVFLSSFFTTVFAQNDTIKSPLTFTGYIETYYTYDFGNPANHTRPTFVYSHNRHNEVNLNLGFVKAAYEKNNVRANLALMTGTYANANLVAEPNVLKNILEANAGVKISATKNLWLDAGIFAAHIGFESAISKDCWTLSRSILADNSPYYESGVKVAYTSDNAKWFLSALVLNGWQRIQRIDGNNMPAFGHQITYKPNQKITLNSSSFVGSDSPDSVRLVRYFHNFYAIFQVHQRFGLTLGFDIGLQQKNPKSNQYNTWFSPVLIAKFSPSARLNIAARTEYYADKNQVIIVTGSQNGFQTYGNSVNIDYKITDNLVWRSEYKILSSKDKIFTEGTQTNNHLLLTSLAISF
ncbi:porin [Emticicia sp.]|uniref:porin n=1 Tax=Emticicia sp. TaxID=1930953 RepID=UPI0037504E4F